MFRLIFCGCKIRNGKPRAFISIIASPSLFPFSLSDRVLFGHLCGFIQCCTRYMLAATSAFILPMCSAVLDLQVSTCWRPEFPLALHPRRRRRKGRPPGKSEVQLVFLNELEIARSSCYALG